MRMGKKSWEVTSLRFVSHSPIPSSVPGSPFSLPKRQAHSSFIAMFPFCLLGAESVASLEERRARTGGEEALKGTAQKWPKWLLWLVTSLGWTRSLVKLGPFLAL